MTTNNEVKLIGILGNEAKIIKTEETEFAAFSIGTSESYKNKETDEWDYTDTIWHEVIAFNPKLIQIMQNYKKLTRLEVTGSLSYKALPIEINGKVVNKKEAKVIASKIDQAPLPKKKQDA